METSSILSSGSKSILRVLNLKPFNFKSEFETEESSDD